MTTNKVVQAALEEYLNLHAEAQRVHNQALQYRRLYLWLMETRKLFPDAFEGLIDTIPDPLMDLAPPGNPLHTLPKPALAVRPTSPLSEVATMVGVIAAEAGAFQVEASRAMRRRLNERALGRLEEILREKGPLHFDDLLRALEQDGFSGYPIDNATALYNALQARARSGNRFVNVGDNRWSLRPKAFEPEVPPAVPTP